MATFPSFGGATPATAGPPIHKDDLGMVEWAECRTTIGRMDTALEDLRKYGFTLVTGLLTAGGIVGSATSSDTAAQVVPAAALIVMVLVLGLFAVDMYYQVTMSGAVERALDLEARTEPPVRVTRYISGNVERTRVIYAIPFVYTVFLGTAAALAWFVRGAHNAAIVVVAATIFVIMAVYWLVNVRGGKLRSTKPRAWSD
jgi:uncharacterized membrane protein